MTLSLLIVDDHEGVANALADLLRAAGFAPVHTADTIAAALGLSRRERIDVVTIDLDLGGEDGLDLLAILRAESPHLPILVLTATATEELAIEALRAGADGFVPKTSSSEDLLAAIAAAAEGHMWLPPELLGLVVRRLMDPDPPSDWELLIGTLSAREEEVLGLMVDGLNRNEIGDRLSISLNTVRTHVKSILAKLGVHASLEAVSLALRAGIRPSHHEGGPSSLSPGRGSRPSAGPRRGGPP